MQWIIQTQNAILNLSPALYPLIGIGYSLFASVHCSIMCSPFLPSRKPNRYFVGRIGSYTTMGLLFGGFGQSLRQSVEYEIVAAIAFVLFAIATALAAGARLLNVKNSVLKNVFESQSATGRGIASAFIPCHLLYFYYSLAVLSASFIGGALILFGHAVTSIPALSYGRRWSNAFSKHSPRARKIARALIVIISIVNLLYFGSRIFYSDTEAKSKMLFCF